MCPLDELEEFHEQSWVPLPGKEVPRQMSHVPALLGRCEQDVVAAALELFVGDEVRPVDRVVLRVQEEGGHPDLVEASIYLRVDIEFLFRIWTFIAHERYHGLGV